MVNGRKNGWSFPLTKATRPMAFCWAVASTTWAQTAAGVATTAAPSRAKFCMRAV